MISKKSREVILSSNKKDSQITTVYHVPTQLFAFRNQVFKMRVHFRSPAGYVNRRNFRGLPDSVNEQIHRFLSHDFRPKRTGIHMAVMAGLVAHFPEIDLDGLKGFRREKTKAMFNQRVGEGLYRCPLERGFGKEIRDRQHFQGLRACGKKKRLDY